MSNVDQEIAGIRASLDHLQARVTRYREHLFEMTMGRTPSTTQDEVAVAKGEVETVEALIRALARRVIGGDPPSEQWEPMQPYCSRNEAKQGDWADQNYDYFQWALHWIQKSRVFLEYLRGVAAAGS
ncbi:MAG: hypothetical protein ACJ8ER_03450 [Allosphingosinicella sp.]